MAISDTPDPGNAKPSDDKHKEGPLPSSEQDKLEEQPQQPLPDDPASDHKLNQAQGGGGTVDDGIPNNDKQLQHTPKDSAPSNPKKRGRRSASADKGEAAATANTPATADRPARERKLVERYSASPSAKAAKSLSIPEGSGAQLKDIPNVAFKLSKLKADDNLQVLHMILFGKKAKAHSLKKNIGRFSGYVWSDDEEKHRAKVKDKLDKCVKEKLVYYCDLLNIPFNKATAKKEDLAMKLLDFLESPHTTTDVLLAEKEQGHKRKRKSEPSKPVSSGEASADGTEKKQKKRAKDVEKQKTPSAIEQDANADDNVPDSGSGDDSNEDNEKDKGSAEEVGLIENKFENEDDAKKEADKEDNSSGKEKAKEAIVEAGYRSKLKKKATLSKSSKGVSMAAEEEAENEGNSSGGKKAKEAKVESGDSSKAKKKATQAKSFKSPSTAAKKSSSSKKNDENAGGSPATLKGSDLKKKSEKDSKDQGASFKGKRKLSSSKKNNENAGGTSGTPASKKLSSKSPGKASAKDQGKSKTSKEAKASPTRKEMHEVVEEILKEVDFNTATLSDILKQLGAHFGVDLYSRKAEVKEIITDVINKMSDEEDEAGEDEEDAKSDDAEDADE